MALLMLLDGIGSGVLLLTLAGALALTIWDCRARDLPFKQTVWWVSLTLLLHVVGYFVLRLWLLSSRQPEAA
ncbi:MAG: hypothetical protein ACR2QK_25300 [Acidimicrobiales bacterium]